MFTLVQVVNALRVKAALLAHSEKEMPAQIIMGGLDHQVLLVQLEDQTWVCDVGFGGQTPKLPVLLTHSLDEAQNSPGLVSQLCNPTCHTDTESIIVNEKTAIGFRI